MIYHKGTEITEKKIYKITILKNLPVQLSLHFFVIEFRRTKFLFSVFSVSLW